MCVAMNLDVRAIEPRDQPLEQGIGLLRESEQISIGDHIVLERLQRLLEPTDLRTSWSDVTAEVTHMSEVGLRFGSEQQAHRSSLLQLLGKKGEAPRIEV